MKLKTASPEYIEKAMNLTKEEAERLFARMRGKLTRILEQEKLQSIEVAALQLQLEDEELHEWRQRWAEIADRANKREKKAGPKN